MRHSGERAALRYRAAMPELADRRISRQVMLSYADVLARDEDEASGAPGFPSFTGSR